MAAVLLRMALDPDLKQLPPATLERFAPPGIDRTLWLDSLGPTGPAELKLLQVFARIPAPKATFAMGSVGLREVVETWVREFPADAGALTRIVVSATLGVTASVELAARERRLLAARTVVPPADPERETVRKLQEELSRFAREVSPTSAFVACGRPLWVSVPGSTLAPDFGTETYPLEVDLNSAGTVDLLGLPGFDLARARRVLALRDERGFFGTLDDFFTAAELSAEQHKLIVPLSDVR